MIFKPGHGLIQKQARGLEGGHGQGGGAGAGEAHLEAGGLVLDQPGVVPHGLERDPELRLVAVVVLRLHSVQGEEALPGELALHQGEVVHHHAPLLVTHLFSTGPPVKQVELSPADNVSQNKKSDGQINPP